MVLAGCTSGRSTGLSGSWVVPEPVGARSQPPSSAAGTPGVEESGPAAPARSPAPPSVILARSHVPVLCFHQIRDWTEGDSGSARTIITPPQRFDAQMGALADAGYRTITPEQLLAYLQDGTPLPPRPVLLSFDDASEGQYTHALPVLLRHGFTATYFVMTVVLDKSGWLSRDQVRDLSRQGMTIGAHTWDHHPVTHYDEADWRIQLVEPARELGYVLDRPVRLFAYPYGVWNQAALPHVAAAGYEAAFQLSDSQDASQPLFTIRRVMARSDWDGSALLHQIATNF
jgi:peptidoglycan/xylan/chitin deacetylase (PgdA/CDA1 family)